VRTIKVEPLPEGSIEPSGLVDKKSYRVVISEGADRRVVEAKLPLSALEGNLSRRPEEIIREWFEPATAGGSGGYRYPNSIRALRPPQAASGTGRRRS
jgi:hypothetical protein